MAHTPVSVLELFHPLVGSWFQRDVGTPTDVQTEAWPRIRDREHVLATAPTGCGKTLAAFLWALNQLITGAWETGRTRVLYVSPLRALNNDVQRNLVQPLQALKERFAEAGQPFPEIRVMTRSGDTPASQRRRMLLRPPEILITTPESLNLLLSTESGCAMLRDLESVILDEIHAVVAGKRGVHLNTAVERLTLLAGEFQRIALSATVRPLDAVAAYVGGFRPGRNGQASARPVSVLQSGHSKRYDLRVQGLQDRTAGAVDSAWDLIVPAIKERIARNRSILIFARTRSRCEQLTQRINAGEVQPLAYAHHGALSREFRAEVEGRMKRGELRAIVATNSLELGIDIGALDEVVLIQTPQEVTSAVQRAGRAGHRVGEVSRATLLPTHPHDILEAAVLTDSVLRQDIEDTCPVRGALDVLAQVIVSMVTVEPWPIEGLYTFLKSTYTYRELSRRQFDLVLDMLRGRYAETRIRELAPRVAVDLETDTVFARRSARLALLTSGGTIPDRGYFRMRHQGSGSVIGELDEEFVWEAWEGKQIAIGTQTWRIEKITHNDVLVLPGRDEAGTAPFWRGEALSRSAHFSERLAEFLESADEVVRGPAGKTDLRALQALDEIAGAQLLDYLRRQRNHTGCALPHRHHLVVEHTHAGPGGVEAGSQLILHTCWGGRVNRPYALALQAAWANRFGTELECYPADDTVCLVCPEEIEADELLGLVDANRVEQWLRQRLERSGFFGARFREAAGRALLLPRRQAGRRMPLWLNRLKSQKLLQAVGEYEEFPMVLEAWRCCLQDEMELGVLRRRLDELAEGVIRWTEIETPAPSPFAQNSAWRQVSSYMYQDDTPRAGGATALRPDLLREVLNRPDLRPVVSRALVVEFESKRRRTAPGYAPPPGVELLEWVAERGLIPWDEWEALLTAATRDHGRFDDPVPGPAARLVRVSIPATAARLIAARGEIERWLRALDNGAAASAWPNGRPAIPPPAQVKEDADELLLDLLPQWLSYYGPVSPKFVSTRLGLAEARLAIALADLEETGQIIRGRLVDDGGDDGLCDSENFEILLRRRRAGAAPSLKPAPAGQLPLFLALIQGLGSARGGPDRVTECVEQLAGYSARSEMWEAEILPARVDHYRTADLDACFQEQELHWQGGEGRQVHLYGEPDLPLVVAADAPRKQPAAWESLFPHSTGKYGFGDLLRESTQAAGPMTQCLWEGVWAGAVSAGSWAVLRKAIQARFRFPETDGPSARAPARRTPGRAALWRRRKSWAFGGDWYLVPRPTPPAGPVERDEQERERVRLLLDRYGILFRELLQREAKPFAWSALFRALRLMELAGEVVSGHFFEGIGGPQFLSHPGLRLLQRGLPRDRVYWLNAADPASVCGLSLPDDAGPVPSRLATTHLVYRGGVLLMVSRRRGKQLQFMIEANDPDAEVALAPLRHLLERSFQPMRCILVESINRGNPAQGPYLAMLRTAFEVITEVDRVRLYRKLS